jgi:hypothetical protein
MGSGPHTRCGIQLLECLDNLRRGWSVLDIAAKIRGGGATLGRHALWASTCVGTQCVFTPWLGGRVMRGVIRRLGARRQLVRNLTGLQECDRRASHIWLWHCGNSTLRDGNCDWRDPAVMLELEDERQNTQNGGKVSREAPTAEQASYYGCGVHFLVAHALHVRAARGDHLSTHSAIKGKCHRNWRPATTLMLVASTELAGTLISAGPALTPSHTTGPRTKLVTEVFIIAACPSLLPVSGCNLHSARPHAWRHIRKKFWIFMSSQDYSTSFNGFVAPSGHEVYTLR